MRYQPKPKMFTLVELIVAMGVFAVLMLVLMQFFSSAQSLWTKSSGKTETFENARIAMNMIAGDIQNIYYEVGHDSTKKLFTYINGADPSRLYLATVRASKPNSSCRSSLCKVQYKVASDKLYINVIGDYNSLGAESNDKVPGAWPFMSNSTDPVKFITTLLDDNIDSGANPDGWKEVISGVVDFSYAFYDNTAAATAMTVIPSPSGAGYATVPYKVFIKLRLVNMDVYSKFQTMHPGKTLKEKEAEDIVKNNIRTFSRMLIIDRRQYP